MQEVDVRERAGRALGGARVARMGDEEREVQRLVVTPDVVEAGVEPVHDAGTEQLVRERAHLVVEPRALVFIARVHVFEELAVVRGREHHHPGLDDRVERRGQVEAGVVLRGRQVVDVRDSVRIPAPVQLGEDAAVDLARRHRVLVDRADPLDGTESATDGASGFGKDVGVDPDDLLVALHEWLPQDQALLPGRRAAACALGRVERFLEADQVVAVPLAVAAPVWLTDRMPARGEAGSDCERHDRLRVGRRAHQLGASRGAARSPARSRGAPSPRRGSRSGRCARAP